MSRVARCAKRPEDASKNTRTACGQRQRRRYLRRQRSPEHDCWDDANDGDNGFSGSWGGPLSAGRGRFANRKGRSSFHKKREQSGESTLERSCLGFIQGPIAMHYFLSGLFCCLSQTSLFQRFSRGKKLRIRAAASDSVMRGWFWAMMGVQKSIISCMVQSRVKAPF